MLQSISENVSQVIYQGKGIIKSITIDGEGAVGVVTIYDGSSSKQKRLFRCNVPDGYSFSPFLSEGIPFQSGLYVVVNASTTNYNILISNEEK